MPCGKDDSFGIGMDGWMDGWLDGKRMEGSLPGIAEGDDGRAEARKNRKEERGNKVRE